MARLLSAGQRWAYALPGLFLTIVALPLYIFIPKFYSDVVGVDVARVGLILFLAQLFDALSDPAVGLLSDLAPARWGRRRVFMLPGSLLLAVGMYLLLAPPEASDWDASSWLAVSIFLVYLSWTLVTVPYEALGIEITTTYDERTRVMGLREGLALVGILVAVVSPSLIVEALGLPDDAEGERKRFRIFAGLYGPLMAASCWLCALTARERRDSPRRDSTSFWQRLKAIAGNRPYRILLLSFALASAGASLPAALMLYFIRYVLGSESPDSFLILYMASGIVFVPAWLWLAQRFEKRTAWLTALALNTLSYLLMLFVGPGDETLFRALVLFAGFPFGALMAIPSAMQADAVDHGEQDSDNRQEGSYVGIWNVARKVPGAIVVGVALGLLGASGYEPNAAQAAPVRDTLRLLFCLAPSALLAAAFVAALAYDIDRQAHDRIRTAIGRDGIDS